MISRGTFFVPEDTGGDGPTGWVGRDMEPSSVTGNMPVLPPRLLLKHLTLKQTIAGYQHLGALEN
jgi:hypothetical protein